MIIVDYNQVSISNLMIQRAELSEDFARHMILNSIRSYKQKFGKEYGDIVIACDDKNYWRKNIFPYYKAHRKDDRDKSSIDWQKMFTILAKIREEIKENFPYRVLRIPNTEADDIIAALCHKFGTQLNNSTTEKILILSADHDMGQLQKYANVSQYDPIRNKWLKQSDPVKYLKEHIIRGDRGDGIPNILSPDSAIVSKERQKPVTTKKLNMWLEMEPEEFCDDTMLRNYRRNEAIVDLSRIPEDILEKINKEYDTYEIPKRRGLLNYFIKNRLRNLMSSIQEF